MLPGDRQLKRLAQDTQIPSFAVRPILATVKYLLLELKRLTV